MHMRASSSFARFPFRWRSERLAVICCSDLGHNGARRLLRDRDRDEPAIRVALQAAGVLFVAENGEGAGGGLRRAPL